MHESSLIHDVIEQVEKLASKHHAKKVVAVELLQGALDSSGQQHLHQHFRAAAPGTVIAGAELRISPNPDPLSGGIILQTVELDT